MDHIEFIRVSKTRLETRFKKITKTGRAKRLPLTEDASAIGLFTATFFNINDTRKPSAFLSSTSETFFEATNTALISQFNFVVRCAAWKAFMVDLYSFRSPTESIPSVDISVSFMVQHGRILAPMMQCIKKANHVPLLLHREKVPLCKRMACSLTGTTGVNNMHWLLRSPVLPQKQYTFDTTITVELFPRTGVSRTVQTHNSIFR